MTKELLFVTNVLKVSSNTTTNAINADNGSTSKTDTAEPAPLTNFSTLKDASALSNLLTDKSDHSICLPSRKSKPKLLKLSYS